MTIPNTPHATGAPSGAGAGVIQYAPNAAGISWLALCEALEDRATIERILFGLSASNTDLSIKQTKNNADNTQRAAEDQAQLTQIQGITSMVQAGAQGTITAVTNEISKDNAKKANTPVKDNFIEAQRDTNEIEMKPLSTSKNVNNPNPPPAPALSNVPPSEPQPIAQVVGKNIPGENDSGKNDANNTTKNQNTNTQANKTQQNEYEQAATWWAQNNSTFCNIASQFADGFGKMAQTGFFSATTNYIEDQGKAQAAAAIAQGLNTVFNNESSMIASAISSCDSYMQNTNGTLSTIIQVSSRV